MTVVTAISLRHFQNEEARRTMIDTIGLLVPLGPDQYLSVHYGRDPAAPDLIAVWAVAKDKRTS